MKRFIEVTGTTLIRYARRMIVTVVGGTVVVLGLVMILTPGPAFLVIPMGLAILAIEFAWARRLLRRVKEEGPRGISIRLRRLLRVYSPPWGQRGPARTGSRGASPPDLEPQRERKVVDGEGQRQPDEGGRPLG